MNTLDIENKLNQLTEIEKKGILKYLYEGVNIWPLIRTQLQFDIIDKKKGFSKKKQVQNRKYLANIKGKYRTSKKYKQIENDISKFLMYLS